MIPVPRACRLTSEYTTPNVTHLRRVIFGPFTRHLRYPHLHTPDSVPADTAKTCIAYCCPIPSLTEDRPANEPTSSASQGPPLPRFTIDGITTKNPRYRWVKVVGITSAQTWGPSRRSYQHFSQDGREATQLHQRRRGPSSSPNASAHWGLERSPLCLQLELCTLWNVARRAV